MGEGATLSNTDEIYAPYQNGEVVGQALKLYRQQMVMATQSQITSNENK
ncbi:hypothetical protein [Snodgrassella alvi]|nr:hypothetical protein [Snodgrassella alvi]